MNGDVVLVLLVVAGVPVLLVIWLVNEIREARRRCDDLEWRLQSVERELARQKPSAVQTVLEERPKFAATPPPVPERKPEPVRAAPPPPPAPPRPVIIEEIAERPAPPPLPAREPLLEPVRPAVNWEQFMGVKLFAWLGGLALFLGVAFFVKYSFDNNLVPPALRAALGFLAGLGLLVGGVWMSRKNYATLSQTLCGTGVVVLYAVIFACRAFYHFEFFGPLLTFALMVLVTAVAFLLAVRLNALIVAILGILGGFLTPILLSTGQDNPVGLFGYLAMLDAGLLLVALNRRWHFLNALGALATALMQLGWAAKFFVAEKYFDGDKIFIALGVLLGFLVLFAAATAWARRRAQTNPWLTGSGLGLAAVALAFSAWFLTFEPLGHRPALMFSLLFIIDALITGLVLLDHTAAAAQPLAGLAVFALLGFWTAKWLGHDLLNTALVFYFVFAVSHSVLPLVLQRRFGLKAPLWSGHVFPALALVLVLAPIFQFAEISFLVWPFVLLVDLLAIAVAFVLGSMISVLAVFLLTLAAIGALIFKIPGTLTGLPVAFFLLAGFAVFFVGASLWIVRKLRPGMLLGTGAGASEDLTTQLPVFSAVLPFLLLIMAALRLALTDPSPIFGVGLLLVILLLGVAKLLSLDILPAVGLACAAAMEIAWHFNRFDPALAVVPLIWYLVFFAVFTVYPFLFLRKFENKTIPWAAAALAGPPQFFLVHRLVGAAYPNQIMGLIPLAFAVPALLCLVIVLRKIPPTSPARLNQLAWFGGVALFFITLIFPIQFERQWITIGWALEGAALLWLFHRVPHPGLREAGVWLLFASFVRLALNPAVLDYHPRSATPILNWYLYAYGIVTVCLFAGARLLAPPRNMVRQVNVVPVLAGLGAGLAFLLLNIETADFFSPPGSTLTFQFSGNFARDMSYTIAWAIYALILLVWGIFKKSPAPRYAALGLLSVALLKLFLHDLAQLGQLYRIGAFIGVAIIAMLASFAYQRFFAAAQTKEPIAKAP